MTLRATYRPLLAALLLSLSLPTFLPASEQVVSSHPDGVTFAYIPEFWAPGEHPPFVPPASGGEGNGPRLQLRDGDFERIAGEPLRPVRIVTIAVPPGSHPTARLLEWESGQSWDGALAIYQEENTPPSSPPQARVEAVVGHVGNLEVRSLLGLAVVRVPLYPTRSEGLPQRVTAAQRMVVRVDFNPPRQPVTTTPPSINRLHRLAVLNAEQAAGWGSYRTSDFGAPSWPNGYLYRFECDEEGIYALSFEDLRSGGVDITAEGLPSGQIKLFGNGGTELPLAPDAPAPLGLNECAIYIGDGGDDWFGPGDTLLFYGRGAGGWVVDTAGIRYSLNRYTLRNRYWLNIDPAGGGKRMVGFAVRAQSPRAVETVPCRIHLEPEEFIYGGTLMAGAGREWYGYTFDGIAGTSYSFSLTSVDTAADARLNVRLVKATSGLDPLIRVSVNGYVVGSMRPDYYYSNGERRFDLEAGVLQSGYNNIRFEQTTSGAAQALFDWLEVSYSGHLDRGQTFEGVAAAGAVEYRTLLADAWFFDVTVADEVKFERGEAAVAGASPAYRRFIMLSATGMSPLPGSARFEEYSPPVSSDIADPWSAGNRADVILIVPDGYWEAAQILAESYPRRNPPLLAKRARLSELYNRFAGGLRDPGAIRNFLHFAKDFWAKPVPQFVVFCGDGDYNYRDLRRLANPDFLPPYEAGYEKGSSSSDDWFVDFTPGARDLIPEMAHGRLTVNQPSEMAAVARKIIAYDEEPEFGLWRDRITLVADDENSDDSNQEDEHVGYSEDVANQLPGSLERVKIYLTEYQRQWGREKPLAADDLIGSINRGTLVVNFMGHGNPTLWAHERVFALSRDLSRIEPSRRLPLYLAFTCDWAYWDDPSAQSFPEQLLVDPNGGAIGAIASTRLTYSWPNANLARNFFANQFPDPDSARREMTTGEALWQAKRDAWGSISPTYHLLGDPALRLGSPRRRGTFAPLSPSPLVPLAGARAAGTALDARGQRDTGFNGELVLVLLDTAVPRQYLIPADPPITLNYVLPGATAYRGFLRVTNGNFGGSFVVPRDVTLGGDRGRALAYFYDESEDGVAFLDTIHYANRAAVGTDDDPPLINLFFDHRGYRAGDDVSPEPLTIIDVFDSSGVNITGAMGHGIWLTVDDGKPLNLTGAFQYDLDDHQRGSLEQRIGPLTTGLHRIKVEAWDSFNNLAMLNSSVKVAASGNGLVVDRVLNYPNPFHERTALTFTLNNPAEYEIKIFTVGGRMIRRFRGSAEKGLVTEAEWDGRDEAGARAGNGVYLYKVTAWDDEGGKAEGLGRIAFIR